MSSADQAAADVAPGMFSMVERAVIKVLLAAMGLGIGYAAGLVIGFSTGLIPFSC